MGHSFIHWAHKRSSQRCYTSNLSFPPDSVKIFWKGIRGMRWNQLFLILSNLAQSWPLPSILIIHLGGNDIGKVSTMDLIFMIKRDLQRVKLSFPNTRVVFSEVVPRLVWMSSPRVNPLEKIRRRINHSVEKFMPYMNGFSWRHVDLEGGFQGLYRRDGIHLSDIGLDIFNVGLQNCIEMAAVVG